jgi:hypothetical protein
MKSFAIVATILVLAPYGLSADQPSTAGRDVCAATHDRIVGPRTKDRPLPLMSGDEAHGFRPACSVPWNILSPHDEPIPIVACFRGNLLQIENDKACGGGTGRLWISVRWVVTRAASEDSGKVVVCQHLDTASYAGTRGLTPPCVTPSH